MMMMMMMILMYTVLHLLGLPYTVLYSVQYSIWQAQQMQCVPRIIDQVAHTVCVIDVSCSTVIGQCEADGAHCIQGSLRLGVFRPL